MMSRRKILSVTLSVVLLLSWVVPSVILAQSDPGLVPCGNTTPVVLDSAGKKVSGGTIDHPCGWNDAIALVVNIANYLIILGAAVSALAFAYAGFLMLTAGGEMNKIEEAKSIFGKVVVGFVIMLSAWLIVHAIEAAFIAPESGIQSLLG